MTPADATESALAQAADARLHFCLHPLAFTGIAHLKHEAWPIVMLTSQRCQHAPFGTSPRLQPELVLKSHGSRAV